MLQSVRQIEIVEFLWCPSYSSISGNEIVVLATRHDFDEDNSDDLQVLFTNL